MCNLSHQVAANLVRLLQLNEQPVGWRQSAWGNASFQRLQKKKEGEVAGRAKSFLSPPLWLQLLSHG
ncbi:hypothetical protein AMECASPLE_003557 [Ameca splendens]|uniref:Uncharacterized protein n=1 Tax=Ameca splendens TaxID=208324 RepID=A0ABV0XBM9_9TELE